MSRCCPATLRCSTGSASTWQGGLLVQGRRRVLRRAQRRSRRSYLFDEGLARHARLTHTRSSAPNSTTPLLKCAERRGCRSPRRACASADVRPDESGRRRGDGRRRLRARYVVDATGQDALLARSRNIDARIEGFGMAAVSATFDGLVREVWNETRHEGRATSASLIVEDGWAWLIPAPWRARSAWRRLAPQRHQRPRCSNRPHRGSPHDAATHRGAAATPSCASSATSAASNRTPHGSRWACHR